MLMLWDGNRQIQEYTDEQIFTTVYEQGSFEPVARIVQLSEVLEKQRIDNAVTHVWQYVPSGIVTQDVLDNVEKAKQPLVKIYHYHNNHLGTPQELSDDKGDIVWLSYDRAWGGSFETIYKPQFIDNYALNEFELQPIKFQGQSLDVETGLHYNRFRYYDSDVGMFISRDPIGLLGGFNVFAYAPNPIGWIDPWGLIKTTIDGLGNTVPVDEYGIPDRTQFKPNPSITQPYKRPFGTTANQRANVQNLPCVVCGSTTGTKIPDHIDALTVEYYRTGKTDSVHQNSTNAVQPHCSKCSCIQGGKASAFAKAMNKILGI